MVCKSQQLAPSAILSLWDMKPFALFELLDMVRRLESIATSPKSSSDDEISRDFRTELAERSKLMFYLCEECGLTSAADQMLRIIHKIEDSHPLTYKEFRASIPDLLNRIEDESKRQLVMTIDARLGKDYFLNSQFFDSEDTAVNKVSIQFSTAGEDIAEAGKCLACGRSTACVMHLNRIMEVGLKSLAAAVGIPQQNDWGKYLQEIGKELQSRFKNSGARTSDEQFYSETAITFDAVRRAWRNPTMHVDKMYSSERAEEILISVRSFMRHLATKLHD